MSHLQRGPAGFQRERLRERRRSIPGSDGTASLAHANSDKAVSQHDIACAHDTTAPSESQSTQGTQSFAWDAAARLPTRRTGGSKGFEGRMLQSALAVVVWATAARRTLILGLAYWRTPTSGNRDGALPGRWYLQADAIRGKGTHRGGADGQRPVARGYQPFFRTCLRAVRGRHDTSGGGLPWLGPSWFAPSSRL